MNLAVPQAKLNLACFKNQWGNKLPPFFEYKYHYEKKCTASHLGGFFYYWL